MIAIDLEPASLRVADLIGGVAHGMLDRPTPCRAFTVADLLDHIGGLSLAFTAAAAKATTGDLGSGRPVPDGSRLGDDWRTRIPQALAALVEAWRDPEAWTGMTRAGGVDLPGEVAGLVVLEELLVHGWDLAKASGQAYHCDQASLETTHGFIAQFYGPDQAAAREELFGPVVPVPDDAPLLDRLIGLTGRDPAWAPA